MFIFYELLTLATYPLVVESGTEHAKKAGHKYLLFLMLLPLVFLMPMIIYTGSVAGTLDFVSGGTLANKIDNKMTIILLCCTVFGLSKMAIMPLHQWLPSAMVAPIPVSALLHAVAVVKAGIFCFIKIIIYIFGLDNLYKMASDYTHLNSWLIFLACFTILVSSILAVQQKTIKKLLAYSTIAQLSYCIVAVAIFTPQAILASIFHMIAHAVSKITLFFAAGAIYTATHITDIKDLNSISKLMPITSFCFAVGALSMVGIPPLAIFFSKLYILQSVWSSKYGIMIAFTMLISTILNYSYFIPIIHRMYFQTNANQTILYKGVPSTMLFSLIFTTCLIIIFYLFFPYITGITSLVSF
jgi:multicomponent Na+:H+ antiporter subunit D